MVVRFTMLPIVLLWPMQPKEPWFSIQRNGGIIVVAGRPFSFQLVIHVPILLGLFPKTEVIGQVFSIHHFIVINYIYFAHLFNREKRNSGDWAANCGHALSTTTFSTFIHSERLVWTNHSPSWRSISLVDWSVYEILTQISTWNTSNAGWSEEKHELSETNCWVRISSFSYVQRYIHNYENLNIFAVSMSVEQTKLAQKQLFILLMSTWCMWRSSSTNWKWSRMLMYEESTWPLMILQSYLKQRKSIAIHFWNNP